MTGSKSEKRKIDKLDFIKLNYFCVSKDSTKKIKGSSQNKRTYFHNTFDKGFVSKVCKEIYNPVVKR